MASWILGSSVMVVNCSSSGETGAGWFVSDSGSDEHDCLTESTPCRSLQTVLDRVSEQGALGRVTQQKSSIFVTSSTLRLQVQCALLSILQRRGRLLFAGTKATSP